MARDRQSHRGGITEGARFVSRGQSRYTEHGEPEPVVLRFTVRGNLSLLLGRTLADAFRKAGFTVR